MLWIIRNFLSKINEKLSKLSNKSTFRLSVAREIKTKVILTANQKKENTL